jgi:nitroreductase
VVDDQDIKEEISNNMSNRVLPLNHFTRQAPVHVAIVEEKMNFTSKFGATVKHKHFPFIDIGIAAEHFCLQAVSEGLGTCLLGWFNEPAVKKLLNIPKNKRVPLIITLGYPAKELRQKIRKEISEIHSFNTYE